MTETAVVTVCGRPNVGKSTLTNALVGEKIAIVSNKPQTTRNRIMGIVTKGDTQFILLDTPGFIKPRNRLGDYMVNVVKESVTDVDCVLFLIEPVPEIGPGEAALLDRIRESGVPAVLVINPLLQPGRRYLILIPLYPFLQRTETGLIFSLRRCRSMLQKVRISSRMTA